MVREELMPIPWPGLEMEDVSAHRYFNCSNYEKCLSEMCKYRFLESWSCSICDEANGKLKL